MQHPHDILGVDRDADIGAVKRAFLQQAKTAHPDTGGSKQHFIRLKTAYETILDRCTLHEVSPEVRLEHSSTCTERKSYEDIVKPVRDQLEREDERRHRAARTARQISRAAILISICAVVAGTWLFYDGYSWGGSFSSFSCNITVAVLVCVAGVVAVGLALQVTSSQAVHRRLTVVILIVAVSSLLPSGRLPTNWRPTISRNLVPEWWSPAVEKLSHALN